MKIGTIFAVAIGLCLTVPAMAEDARNLNPGISTDELMHTAPVHWVSVDQIEASLEGQPPMAVGFDVDDTLLFSSPCFYHGREKYSPGSEDYLKNIEFWKEVNAGCDDYSIPKQVGRALIDMHQKRGDDIYFITGRTYTEGEKLSAILAKTFGVKTMHPVVFTQGSDAKTSFMREHALKIYYGDADSDMRSALEVDARPIRVLRAPNSTYLPLPKNGSFGEEVIIDSAY